MAFVTRGLRHFSAGLLVLLLTFPAFAADTVGDVSRVQGTATGMIDSRRLSLSAGDNVFRDERLLTGPDSRLQATLTDGTTLTMGERAVLVLDDLVVGPAGTSGSATLMTGALRLVSRAGAAAPTEMAVKTPVGTIGIRGTDFWVGPVDRGIGVLLQSGRVAVITRGGVRLLTQPGQATVMTLANVRPLPVEQWSATQQAQALATTSFKGVIPPRGTESGAAGSGAGSTAGGLGGTAGLAGGTVGIGAAAAAAAVAGGLALTGGGDDGGASGTSGTASTGGGHGHPY